MRRTDIFLIGASGRALLRFTSLLPFILELIRTEASIEGCIVPSGRIIQ